MTSTCRTSTIVFLASWSLSCTFTQSEFDPTELPATSEEEESQSVSPLQPQADASTPFEQTEDELSGAVDAGAARGGCQTQDDCPNATACINEVCTLEECAPNENGAGCTARLCSGPECEDSTSESTDVNTNSVEEPTPESCDNSLVDQDESDIDCGGQTCSPCAPDSVCSAEADCDSGVCSNEGLCTVASCEDGTKNQSETDVDCGGDCPTACDTLSGCTVPTDCASNVCTAQACEEGLALCCQPVRCDDDIQNGTESGQDCGAPASGCGLCEPGTVCQDNSECQSGLCDSVCLEIELCTDRIFNGTETDLDCGGVDLECARCGLGERCQENTDCSAELSCDPEQLRCVSCDDGERNGQETDVDCGGPGCSACVAGSDCRADTDCSSLACEDGLCCGATGANCVRCAERFAPPALQCDGLLNLLDQTDCTGVLACLQANPLECPNLSAPTCTNFEQGVCQLNDFGGPGGQGVTTAQALLTAAGCDGV